MFDEIEMGGDYDEAFSPAPEDGRRSPQPRKTSSQQFAFWGANAFVLPLVALCYLTVSAEGLRQMMPAFSLRLYKTPVPGVGLLREYDGWDRIDLAMVVALLMFGAVAYLWRRVFVELMGSGSFIESRVEKPVLFYLLATVCGVVLLGDCAIFYLGLEARASSGWSDTPGYVPALATFLYMAGLALIGAWHADYACHGEV